jgi:hypothetical protein
MTRYPKCIEMDEVRRYLDNEKIQQGNSNGEEQG